MIYVSSVNIEAPSQIMAVGDSACFGVTVLPDGATKKSVHWRSSNTSIITVNKLTGFVMAQSPGEATIYATAQDGSGVYGSCTVIVMNALEALKQCYVRIDTSMNVYSILEANNHDVILGKGQTVYLLDHKSFSDNKGRSWYRILYNGMMVYVTNDGSFKGIALPPLGAPTGCNIVVRISEESLEVKDMPYDNAQARGFIANVTPIILTNEIPQNENWYAIYGQLNDGSYSYGWCWGEYVTIATSIYERTLNVRSMPDTNNGTILGSIANGEEVRLIKKDYVIQDGYTWHKILYNNQEAYVIAGESSDNFTFENCLELRNSETTDDNGYIGDYRDFLQILADRESSNNYNAVTGSYLGRYQMGPEALQDIGFLDSNKNWTELAATCGVVDKNTFLSTPDAQETAIRMYHKKLWEYIVYFDLVDKVGEMYQNVIITDSGLVAATHLVGIGNIISAINNNTPVADGNGTLASDYMSNMSNYDMSEIK